MPPRDPKGLDKTRPRTSRAKKTGAKKGPSPAEPGTLHVRFVSRGVKRGWLVAGELYSSKLKAIRTAKELVVSGKYEQILIYRVDGSLERKIRARRRRATAPKTAKASAGPQQGRLAEVRSKAQEIVLPDDIYDRLMSVARARGVSPAEWIAERLPPATVEGGAAGYLSAARRRLWSHVVSTGHATGTDNEGIDADLARAYGDSHEGAVSPGPGR